MSQLEMSFENVHFYGSDIIPELDTVRLTGALCRVFEFMKSGEWHTLKEIEEATGSPQASASAHLRHLTRKDCGFNVKNKRRRGEPKHGVLEYQIIVNTTVQFEIGLRSII